MNNGLNQNLILKGIGGFYYVKTAYGILECRAKGIFRKEKLTPTPGDFCLIEQDKQNDINVISQILDRKNLFKRPPIANVDNLVIVVSTVEPLPNRLLIDKLVAVAEKKDIKPIIVVTKTDLKKDDDLIKTYRSSGFLVFDVMSDTNSLEAIKQQIKTGVTMFEGNSGVGKSTLINALCPTLSLETGETSKKLGRGKHTTRAVELFEFLEGYLADTPGFSALEIEKLEPMKKNELCDYFSDFKDYRDNCRFAGCSHTVEKGCAVLEALNLGKIQPSRHESYMALYENLKSLNEWELKN